MFGFMITDLLIDEESFEVPSSLGKWKFQRTDNYDQISNKINDRMCGNTFMAFHSGLKENPSNSDFDAVCNEIVDICSILSWMTAKCVTVSGSTPYSVPSFIQLGDIFLRSRAIVGFNRIETKNGISVFFDNWLRNITIFKNRRMRLFLTHWISGLTCFSLEDIFLSTCVEMDIVKQCERSATGNDELSYYQGMESASSRYGIQKLGSDYKNMRNDLIHDGKLSSTNNSISTKSGCAAIVSDSLNWIDQYVICVLNVGQKVQTIKRWDALEVEHCLPSMTLFST